MISCFANIASSRSSTLPMFYVLFRHGWRDEAILHVFCRVFWILIALILMQYSFCTCFVEQFSRRVFKWRKSIIFIWFSRSKWPCSGYPFYTCFTMYFAIFGPLLSLSLFNFAWICVLTDTCHSFFHGYVESDKKIPAKIGVPSERNHWFWVEFVSAPPPPPYFTPPP